MLRVGRVVCLLGLASLLFGQADRGTITGTVADPAGAVIGNAAIEAKNQATGVTYQAASTNTGNYTIAQLPAGTYEVSVTVPGFKKYTRQGITVEVAQTLRIDVALEVGQASESITVQADAPLLRTESGDISHMVNASNMDALPILGIGAGQAGSSGIRNPYALTELIPGTMWQANAQVRVNGAPNNTQSFRIEGQDASNTGTPGVQAQTQPSVDAIQEVAVQTSNFAAEYGQVGGGMFNVTMKSGTNQFHGTAYDYFVNEAFNAGEPFTDSPNGNPLQRNRRQDWGFTIGGPVWIPKVYNGHDKTFFFFNWEQYRERVDINNQQETVPTDAYKAGNFATSIPPGSGPIGTDALGRPIYAGEIYDPATTRQGPSGLIRDPFANQAIPQPRFDPVAAKIQALFPEPLGPFANGVVNNYIPNIPTSRITEIPSLKLDQAIGPKGRLSFFWQETKTTAPLSFTFGRVDGLPDPLATNVATFQTSQVYRLNYDHTISPTLLLHLGSGYRSNDFYTPNVNEEGVVPNYNAETSLGLMGGVTHNFFPAMNGMCQGVPGPFNFTPYACFGQGGMQTIGGSANGHAWTESPSFNASLTWVKNNHTYKFGVEGRLEGYPAPAAGSPGSYNFSTDQTNLPYLAGTTVRGQTAGFGYASFLLGQVQSAIVANGVDPRLGKHEIGLFAQDSWKITRKLTLDYGLRYDYETYLQEQYGRAPFFSPTTLNPVVGIPGAVTFDGYGAGHCNCQLAKNYPWGFAPRLGLAYQIDSKTVFRGGFGIIYGNTESNNNSSGGLAGSTRFNVTAPGLPVTTLAAGLPASFNPPPWPNYSPGQFNFGPVPVALSSPFMDPNAGRPPRQYEWSVGFQREIAPNMALDVYYVGNRGIWWQAPALSNLNAIPLSRISAAGLDVNNPNDMSLLQLPLNSAAVVGRGLNIQPYAGFPLTQTLGQALRPFPQYTTINTYWDPLGDTWYNALQVKLNKRFSHGLSLLGTFTWSKSMDTGTEIGEPNPGTTGNAVVNDVFNRGINKYLSQYDQPFIFNLSATYVTPKIHTTKVLSYIARDWTYGVFLQYASGFPIEVPLANNNLGAQVFQTSFANRVAGVPLFTVDPNCHCYDPNKTFLLNPAAWSNPLPGQFGTSAAYYNDYRYQRRPSENMNLGRTWPIKESMSFNIRFELTNVFNRSYWGNPSNANFQAPQTLQRNGNAASGFGFMNTITPGFTGALVPRNGMVVARFTF